MWPGRPDWPAPLHHIAWILAAHPEAKVRRPEEAIRLAERAAKLSRHEDPRILDTLATAYAAAGRFDEAVATAETAMELASNAGANELADVIRGRMRLYQQGKPFWEAAPTQGPPPPG